MKTIVYYESLFSWLFLQPLTRCYIRRLKREFDDIKFERRSWYSDKSLDTTVIGLIGHSFGAGSLLYRAMEYPYVFLRNTKFIINIDPRVCFGSKLFYNSLKTTVYNFYSNKYGFVIFRNDRIYNEIKLIIERHTK